MISEDPEIQKMQLQIALGVSHSSPNILSSIPLNRRLKLQEALIKRLKENEENLPLLTEFLNSAYRDFIIRSCDTGQIPCPNAAETVRLLLDAGADPNVDYIDPNSESPGVDFINQYTGESFYEILKDWEHDKEGATAIMAELRHIPAVKISNSPEILLCNLIHHNSPENITKMMNAESDLNNITELFDTVRTKYFANIDKLSDDNPRKIKMLAKFRRAEAIILESIYQKERHDEHRLLHMLKISLFFAPLILPLIFTAIVGIMYAIKKSTALHTVQKTDLTIDEFKNQLSNKTKPDIDAEDTEEFVNQLNTTYAMKFPVKEKDEHLQLRKAIVFNKNTTGAPFMYNPYNRLSSIFNGTSEISPKEEGKLRKDVRIYEVPSR